MPNVLEATIRVTSCLVADDSNVGSNTNNTYSSPGRRGALEMLLFLLVVTKAGRWRKLRHWCHWGTRRFEEHLAVHQPRPLGLYLREDNPISLATEHTLASLLRRDHIESSMCISSFLSWLSRNHMEDINEAQNLAQRHPAATQAARMLSAADVRVSQ